MVMEHSEKTYALNSALQKKKNAVRADLKQRGVLKREGKNAFDKYSYFSEAQYKELFTDLFATHGLELTTSELEYNFFEGVGKQPNGRHVRSKFTLTDTDTGFAEESIMSGEGMDKGDKAGYKAMTGALKYYLASTFMVATGDDPETDSPQTAAFRKAEHAGMAGKKASPKQVEVIKNSLSDEELASLYAKNNVQAVEDLPMAVASKAIQAIIERDKKGGN